MGKIALVVGATGVVGRELVEQLSQCDSIEKVKAFTRRPIEYKNTKVDNHVIDFAQLDNFKDLFVGDFLFSALGTTLKQAGTIEAQKIVDLDYQREVAQIAVTNNIHHYLLVSSSGANSESLSAYLRMKGELENSVLELGFSRVSIFRPSLLLGERRDFRLGEKIGSLLLPSLCRLPWLRKYRPVTGKEVALKMVQVSQTSREGLEIFQLDEILEHNH